MQEFAPTSGLAPPFSSAVGTKTELTLCNIPQENQFRQVQSQSMEPGNFRWEAGARPQADPKASAV